MDWPLIWTAFGASAGAGLATAAGAAPLLVFGKPTPRAQNMLLGFAAGVMLAASFFSLIVPGLEKAEDAGSSAVQAALIVAAAVLLGAAVVHLVNRYVPHEHFVMGRAGVDSGKLARIWLFVFAITLHNLPEGLAVGTSFGGGDMRNGMATAIGIGLQNMPEGLAVAASLMTIDYSRRTAVLVALLSGLVEPVGGFIGIAAVSISSWLLPWGLGFAAGAMILVVSAEIIPETHREGHERVASAGLMIGLVAMMTLDVTLG